MQTQGKTGPRSAQTAQEAIIRELRAMLATPLTTEERERSVIRFARDVLAARVPDP